MKARLIGDLHLGKRFPYTTQASAIQFQRLHREAMQRAENGADFHLQLGDLFDGFSVSGETLVQGYLYAKDKRVLAGNHDKSNNTDKSSALKLLKDAFSVDIVWEDLCRFTAGLTNFYMLPHQLTQEKFESALDEAQQLCKLTDRAINKFKVLLLHCNFGNREGTETENYLRPERAKQLLEDFTLIVSGHEHNFSKPMKGVVMLGSILPFDFGQMTDKFVMDYDTMTGEYELIETWSAQNFSKLNVEEPTRQADFIEFTGTVDVEQASALNKRIAELYKEQRVISIKNSTHLVRHEKEASLEERAEDWLEVVMKQCNEEQQKLLAEMAGELK